MSAQGRTRLLPHALALAGYGRLQEPSILTLLVQDVGGCGDRGYVAVGIGRRDSGRVCKTDLWALGSSLSSEDGLDVLVVPELCLVPPTLSPNGVCFIMSPPCVAVVCASAHELNGLRFLKRFIQRWRFRD